MKTKENIILKTFISNNFIKEITRVLPSGVIEWN
jgi:hypothetical protein